MRIIEATEQQLPLVRSLFRSYQQWIGVDLCFQGFEQELADLPGRYSTPRGCILLAQCEQVTLGCVALRSNDWPEAELKRLYVKPEYHGQGVGRQLFLAALERARETGYTSIVLDTLPSMKAAQDMYQTHGFYEIQPYCKNPLDGVKYYRYQFEPVVS